MLSLKTETPLRPSEPLDGARQRRCRRPTRTGGRRGRPRASWRARVRRTAERPRPSGRRAWPAWRAWPGSSPRTSSAAGLAGVAAASDFLVFDGRLVSHRLLHGGLGLLRGAERPRGRVLCARRWWRRTPPWRGSRRRGQATRAGKWACLLHRQGTKFHESGPAPTAALMTSTGASRPVQRSSERAPWCTSTSSPPTNRASPRSAHSSHGRRALSVDHVDHERARLDALEAELADRLAAQTDRGAVHHQVRRHGPRHRPRAEVRRHGRGSLRGPVPDRHLGRAGVEQRPHRRPGGAARAEHQCAPAPAGTPRWRRAARRRRCCRPGCRPPRR